MRNSWELFDKLITADGDTMRERNKNRAKRDYVVTSKPSLALKHVTINDEERDVIIESGSSTHIKKILSMPDERFYDGDYVLWDGYYWLVSETDLDSEVQYKGIIRQCNKKLRWQNANGEIIERWCATDEKATNTQGVSYKAIVDKVKTNYTIYLPLDNETMKIRRYHRFILDVDLEDPDTYVVTNRNVVSSVYDPDMVHGVILIVLSQDERSQDKDNLELQIADYKEEREIVEGINCEIQYSGDTPNIKVGGSFKTYSAVFYDSEGHVVEGITPVWNVTFVPDTDQYYECIEEDGKLKIKALYEPSIVKQQVLIELSAESYEASCELFAKVVYVL